ncbi:MAG: hypothetical protein V1660_00985 [archaeon]
MVETCSICGRESSNITKGFIDNELKSVCDMCAKINGDMIVVNKPTEAQLKEADRPFSVFERLSRMSRMQMHEDELEERDLLRKKEAQINLTKLAALKSDNSIRKKMEAESKKVEEEKQKNKIHPKGLGIKTQTVNIDELKQMREEMFGKKKSS